MGEMEKRRKSILSQSHCNKKGRKDPYSSEMSGEPRAGPVCAGNYRAGIALKGVLQQRPPLFTLIKDYGCRLWEGAAWWGRGKREEDEKEKQHSLSQRGQKSSRLIDLMILFRSQHNKANSFLRQFKTSFHWILYHSNTAAERKGSSWAGLPADNAAVSFG